MARFRSLSTFLLLITCNVFGDPAPPGVRVSVMDADNAAQIRAGIWTTNLVFNLQTLHNALHHPHMGSLDTRLAGFPEAEMMRVHGKTVRYFGNAAMLVAMAWQTPSIAVGWSREQIECQVWLASLCTRVGAQEVTEACAMRIDRYAQFAAGVTQGDYRSSEEAVEARKNLVFWLGLDNLEMIMSGVSEVSAGELPADMHSVMAHVAANGNLMEMLQLPRVKQALQEIMHDPAAYDKYEGDAEIMWIFEQLEALQSTS